jgi:hypothetical protein
MEKDKKYFTGTLLEKLNQQKERLDKVKDTDAMLLNQEKSFVLLSNEEVSLVFAHRAKALRIQLNKKQTDITKVANLTKDIYPKFEQSGKVTLVNFIKIMRGLGRLDDLENILKRTLEQTVDIYKDKNTLNKKRVR